MAGVLGTITGQVRLDIRQAVASYAALRAQNAKTVYALRGTGDSFISAGKKMTVAGAGLVYIFGKAVQAAAEFERKMDYFAAVTDTGTASMQKLNKYTLKVAQDTIYSAGEIADGFVELGKAGISAQQIMDGVGRSMANLAQAGDIPLETSGQILTSVMGQFNMTAKDSQKIVDLLAGAANASIADIDDLGYSLKFAGGVADQVGVSFGDTLTAISLMAKAGIRGSTAGTSLRQMLVSLPGATGPATEELKTLGIITKDGTNKFFDMKGSLKPLGTVFQILQNSLKGMTREQQLMALKTIFNNRALASAAILTRDGAKGFKQMNAAMKKTTAAEVAGKRLDNLSGDIEILRGNIETLMIQAGSPFQDVLRGWVQNLTKLVQAFSKLPPGVQKGIVEFIGISGVALIAMGTFAMIIGTILKFIVAMKNLVAGIRFVAGALGLIETGGEAASVGLLASVPVIGWVIAAIIALVAVFVLCYKHIKVFRDWVNKVGSSFMNDFVHPLVAGGKAVISWFASLPGKFVSIWNTVTGAVGSFVGKVVGFFTSLPGKIGGALSGAASAVGGFIGGIAHWFAQLPGRVIGTVTAFVGKVVSLLTFHNIGFAIGFVIGTIVRGWINLGKMVVHLTVAMVTAVVKWFAQLPGRIGRFVVALVARAVQLFIQLRAKVINVVAALIARTIGFFKALPGRVASFVASMVARAISLFHRLAGMAVSLAARTVNGFIRFIQQLPGRVAGFIGNMVSRARNFFSNMVNLAVNMGHNVYNGIVNGIRALPGAVSGIIGNVIQAFKDKISSAIAAVRDFASGLWEGFKKGLGIASPSYIERAIWQIRDTVAEGADDLAKHTMRVQKISKRMAKTQFTVGGVKPDALNKMTAARRGEAARARELVGVGARRSDRKTGKGGGHSKMTLVDGELKLHPSGRVFIRGVAQETFDDNTSYDDSLDGMG